MRSPLLAASVLALFAACVPIADPRCATMIIDWIDFVRLDGITYTAFWPDQGRPLTEADLGPVHARVRRKLSGNVCDPSYRSQDGDAAFLEAGTPVHAVKGYAPTFRLAARRGDRIVLYEVDTNPRATRGEDLLDIRGKVRAISVRSAEDGRTEIGRIDDPAKVSSLVALVLEAGVDQSVPPSPPSAEGRRYFVAFELADGTRTTRAFDAATGDLWRGIKAPPEFGAAIEEVGRVR